jgi:N-acylneuraminate cytidylyltransferase/CMP-N,N'-diacetyllegionaminic acid synthase
MYKNHKVLGLIPARGGSKGLPRKNLLPLMERPLIAWTIEQAKASKYLDRIVVSTEDTEIADIARKFGAEVPFMRPAHMATDRAAVIDAIFYTLDLANKSDGIYDVIVLLQPTSPLRTTADIDVSIELLFLKNAGAVVSVCKTEHHPYWSNTLPPDHCMKDFISQENEHKNRQEFPIYYRLNGAIFAASCDYLEKNSSFFGDETFAYIMPQDRSVDIDSIIDFRLAEVLMQSGSYV